MSEEISILKSDYSNPLLPEFIFNCLPSGNYKKIIIKPNWVKHEENRSFPIQALVTDTRLIEHITNACLKKYSSIESIIIGDVPLQSCNWDLLTKQANIDLLISKFEKLPSPTIKIFDLRREKWNVSSGYMSLIEAEDGDPAGYSEIILTHNSFLDPISDNFKRFRVSDYDYKETIKNHHKGYHRYLISNSILECDLFINVPKMKTHQKSGITGALKNLVGINGSKACLVHHQKGYHNKGGDEFSPDSSSWIRLQVNVSQHLQKRSRHIYSNLRKVWTIIKKLGGIKTQGTIENINSKHFYIGSGSWYGNDSIWRMVYDLNNIILHAAKDKNQLSKEKVRDYICFMDGVIAGEGNGPLQPMPVSTNLILCSSNPFLIDLSTSKIMGFDYKKIPLLSNYKMFPFIEWNSVNPDNFSVSMNGKLFSGGLNDVPKIKNFIPPPGWRNHIELK